MPVGTSSLGISKNLFKPIISFCRAWFEMLPEMNQSQFFGNKSRRQIRVNKTIPRKNHKLKLGEEVI